MKTSKLLRLPEVMNRTGLAKSTVYKAIQDQVFPPPVRIGDRAVAWPETAIQSWIDSKVSPS